MIEKAKKYLLEHNVLWVTPADDYRHVDSFCITARYLSLNVVTLSWVNFLRHLGPYSFSDPVTMEDGCHCNICINGRWIGIFSSYSRPRGTEIRIIQY